MSIGDELLHTIKQAVAQAMIDQRPFVYGHIASYDPATHSVRCIIPSMMDDSGIPTLSPWMPMGTFMAGSGSGIQVIPAGGATFENPTGGEQVLIGMFDRQRGVAAVSAQFFNGENQPPATNLPSGASPAVPGDVLISNPSGTLVRLHANGDFEIDGEGKLIATVLGDADITTNGNISAQAYGNASVTVAGTTTVACGDIRLGGTSASQYVKLASGANSTTTKAL